MFRRNREQGKADLNRSRVSAVEVEELVDGQ